MRLALLLAILLGVPGDASWAALGKAVTVEAPQAGSGATFHGNAAGASAAGGMLLPRMELALTPSFTAPSLPESAAASPLTAQGAGRARAVADAARSEAPVAAQAAPRLFIPAAAASHANEGPTAHAAEPSLEGLERAAPAGASRRALSARFAELFAAFRPRRPQDGAPATPAQDGAGIARASGLGRFAAAAGPKRDAPPSPFETRTVKRVTPLGHALRAAVLGGLLLWAVLGAAGLSLPPLPGLLDPGALLTLPVAPDALHAFFASPLLAWTGLAHSAVGASPVWLWQESLRWLGVSLGAVALLHVLRHGVLPRGIRAPLWFISGLIPLREEVYFRIFMLGGLAGLLSLPAVFGIAWTGWPVWIALGVATLLFGLIHADPVVGHAGNDWWMLLPFAYILGYIALTHGVILSLLVHMLYNFAIGLVGVAEDMLPRKSVRVPAEKPR